MDETKFRLTVEEANVLDKIATATKMDCWFYIDEDLHVQDIEEGQITSDAEGVCLLEDGMGYGLDEPQSGGLSPEEVRIAEGCFRRAREALGHKANVVEVFYGVNSAKGDVMFVFVRFPDTSEACVADVQIDGDEPHEKLQALAEEVAEDLGYHLVDE